MWLHLHSYAASISSKHSSEATQQYTHIHTFSELPLAYGEQFAITQIFVGWPHFRNTEHCTVACEPIKSHQPTPLTLTFLFKSSELNP